MLRPLPVDLDELASVLEGDPMSGGGRIDLRDGEVWPHFALEDDIDEATDDEEAQDEDEQRSRWMWVHPRGSREGYRDMQLFIDTRGDAALVDRLTVAITGRGAFRRFKDVIANNPDAAEQWYTLSEDRVRGRARAWLASQGHTPRRPCAADRSSGRPYRSLGRCPTIPLAGRRPKEPSWAGRARLLVTGGRALQTKVRRGLSRQKATRGVTADARRPALRDLTCVIEVAESHVDRTCNRDGSP